MSSGSPNCSTEQTSRRICNKPRKNHRNYTHDGDRVVVVGVGSGVSTIVAAEEVGPSGQVIGYEAAEDLAVATRESKN